MKKRLVAAIIAIAAFTAAAVCTALFFSKTEMLVLYNTQSGQVYKTFRMAEGDEFAVEFIHSVNQSPIKDVFAIRGGRIVVDRTVYSAFGAGVQTEIGEGQTLEYDIEGNMVVSGFNIVFDKVKYIVSTVYDHILYIDGQELNLTELCGKNAHIAFELRN